jgi:hypothetical protein
MKQVITLFGFLLCITLLNAQVIDVAAIPTAVMDEFTLRYPDAKSISWQYRGEQYQADFKNNKMSTMALLSEEGIMLQTETQIKTFALPEPALAYLAKKYADKKIGIASIMEDQAGVITFEAVVERMDFTFDAAGEVMGMNEVVIVSREK